MNTNTAEKISYQLITDGWINAESDEEADVIIFNTCCVRDTAEQKILSHIALAKQLKVNNPNLIIAVIGCLTAKRKIRNVDIILGTADAEQVVEKLGVKIKDIKHEIKDIAYIDITYGCENYCSYCIVPFVRGKLRIRPKEEIIAEFNLIKDKSNTIFLLGQNVNAYPDFPNLLETLAKYDGDFKLNFLSSHPKDFGEDLVKVIARNPKIKRDIHLPIQSGCNKILKAMNRKYTVEEYEAKIKILRKYVPDAKITTDIICGFPGETEEDFQETIETVKRIKFNACYIFPYSNRSGTVADKLEGQLPFRVRRARATKLIEIMRKMDYNK